MIERKLGKMISARAVLASNKFVILLLYVFVVACSPRGACHFLFVATLMFSNCTSVAQLIRRTPRVDAKWKFKVLNIVSSLKKKIQEM